MCIENSEQCDGFTLIELAVVVTVIALVVGGILVGRSVIRNAELQSVIADVDRFKHAVKLFSDKYKYLPGDFPNAATFWGSDAGCSTASVPNTDSTASNSVPKQATCGGDGDGFVGGLDGSAWPTPTRLNTRWRETLRAWQHLANAGFVEGTFSGALSTASVPQPGIAVPRSSESPSGGFELLYSSTIGSSGKDPGGFDASDVYPAAYGHVIEYASGITAVSVGNQWGYLMNPVLTTPDAESIDQRMDDGKPDSGSVMAPTRTNANAPNCTISRGGNPPKYNIAYQRVACALIFITGM